MKVMTLNTHSWLEENSQEKMQQIVEKIIQEDYDVIALQEVNQAITAKKAALDEYFCKTDNQYPIKVDNFVYLIQRLLKQAGHNYYWSWSYNHIGYGHYDEGTALLSKNPLTSSGILVSESADPKDYHTRRVLAAKTKIKTETFYVASCHLSWWENANHGFAAEWQILADYLAQFSGPFLLMGDFNAPANKVSEGYQLVLNSPLQLKDSFLAAEETNGEFTVEKKIDGWQDNQEKLRIDYIFISQAYPILNHQVIFDGKNSPVVSDHYGISVKF